MRRRRWLIGTLAAGALVLGIGTCVVVTQPPPAHRPDLGTVLPLQLLSPRVAIGGGFAAATDITTLECRLQNLAPAGPGACAGGRPACSAYCDVASAVRTADVLLVADVNVGDDDTYAAIRDSTVSVVHVQSRSSGVVIGRQCCPGVAAIPSERLYAIARSALPRGRVTVQRVAVTERWGQPDEVATGESVGVDLG